MAKISEKEILNALSRVRDPDLNQDIVRLGFVKNLRIEGEAVSFDLELTTPACPVKDMLKEQCIHEVSSLGVSQVNVKMTARVRSAPVSGKQPVPGIRNLVAIASGKGGVGKSTVCMNLAVALAQSGARVGLMDCDLYGPSIPSLSGERKRVHADARQRMVPHEAHGIKVMSMGFLVDANQALSWRGPMLHKVLQQFLFGVAWGELDYLLLDLPPGTGDVQLSITQSTPLAAAVLVTTPQKVALLDVEKGMEMFQTVRVPVLGVVENMSYYLCRSCSKKHRIFSDGGGRRIAEKYQLPLLGELPLDPRIPSEFGKGQPLMVRDRDGAAANAFREMAGRLVAELSRISRQWAAPGPDAMEV